MLDILVDNRKFEKLCDILVDDCLKTEIKIQKRFLEFKKKKFTEIYEKIRPVGCQRHAANRLLKINEPKIPFETDQMIC